MQRDKAAQAAYMREYMAERRAKGMCIQCKNPALPGAGGYCADCRAKRAAASQRWRQRRRDEGICPYCGAAPAEPGRVLCASCVEKYRRERHKPESRYNLFGARKFVLDRDGHACRICGRGSPLNLHHIDGRGLGHPEPNHDPTNLITLCKSCHGSLTKFLSPSKDTRLVIELLCQGSNSAPTE